MSQKARIRANLGEPGPKVDTPDPIDSIEVSTHPWPWSHRLIATLCVAALPVGAGGCNEESDCARHLGTLCEQRGTLKRMDVSVDEGVVLERDDQGPTLYATLSRSQRHLSLIWREGQIERYGFADPTRHLTSADLDGDGDLDLVLALDDPPRLLPLYRRGRELEEGLAIEISAEATDLLARDLDGDLQPELLLTRPGGVTIIRGSDGQTRHIEIGEAPNSLDLADLDGDGQLDLALVDMIGETLEILHGDGAGGFVPLTSQALGFAPEDLDLEDTNGDGTIDVIVRSRIRPEITIIEGDGAGGFSQPWSPDSESTPGSGRGVLALPASGAGLFAVAAPEHLLRVMVSDGQPTLRGQADVIGSPATFLSDELLGGKGYIQALFPQTGAHLVVSEILGTVENLNVLQVGDIDDDGYEDLITRADGCKLHVYAGNESGIAETPILIDIPFDRCYSPLQLDDLTGDGIPDLFQLEVFASGVIQVAPGLGNGEFELRPGLEFGHKSLYQSTIVHHSEGAIIVLPQGKDAGAFRIQVDAQGDVSFGKTLMAGQSVWQALSADVDGDAQEDLILSSGSKNSREQLVIHYGTAGDLEIGPVHNLDEVMIPWQEKESPAPNFSAGDLDNDGRAEIVLTTAYELAVLADLDSELTIVDVHSVDVYLGGLPQLGDLNGDGFLDLIVHISSAISYVHGGPGGVFETFGSSLSLRNLSGIRTGDIDGDGRLDLVISDEYEITRVESEEVMLPHLGRRTKLPAVNNEVVLARPESAHGDYNGDGASDLALASVNFLITSWGDDGSFARASASVLIGYEKTYTALSAVDINGDDRDELIVLDSNNDDSSIHILSWGDDTWTSVGDIELDDRPARTLAAADLDNDGIVDIAVALWPYDSGNDSDIPLYIYYGRPSAENMIDFDEAIQLQLPIIDGEISNFSWLDLSLQIADLDGDSRPELLLDGPSTSQTHLIWNDGDRRWTPQPLPVHSARIIGNGELITLSEGELARLPVYGRRLGEPATISTNVSVGDDTLIDGFSDCNGDGIPDLMIEHYVGTDLWIAVGDSFVRVWRTLGDNVRCEDLNNDGSLDMFAASDIGVFVTLNGATQ